MLTLTSSALPPFVFYFIHRTKFNGIISIPVEWSAINFWYYLLRVNIRLQSFMGSVQHNSTLTSDTSHTSGGFEVTCASNQLATNLGGSNKFFIFDHLLNWFTKVKTSVYLKLQLFCKGYDLGPSKWMSSGMEQRPSLSSSHRINALLSPGTLMCSTTRTPNHSLVCRVFISVSLGRHDWLNHWPHDWTQNPP